MPLFDTASSIIDVQSSACSFEEGKSSYCVVCFHASSIKLSKFPMGLIGSSLSSTMIAISGISSTDLVSGFIKEK